MGDTAGAMSDFLRAQKKAPHASAPHIDIGDLFFARKDYSRAIAHYSDALSIEPTLALTLCRRGICHHYKRQPDRAIDDLRAAQRIDPEMPNIERYIHMVQPNTRR
jgi:tetratricopeptide (TPR) repeat protein